MTRLTLEEIYIKSLKGELPEDSMAYMTKEAAYSALRNLTGQDFGYDADKWKIWIEENGLPGLGITPHKE